MWLLRAPAYRHWPVRVNRQWDRWRVGIGITMRVVGGVTVVIVSEWLGVRREERLFVFGAVAVGGGGRGLEQFNDELAEGQCGDGDGDQAEEHRRSRVNTAVKMK